MGLFDWLIGKAKDRAAPEVSVEGTEYRGYMIYPIPAQQGSSYRVSGRICREIEGEELRTYQFERSDLLPNEAQANELMLMKAKRFIDERGDQMFNDQPIT